MDPPTWLSLILALVTLTWMFYSDKRVVRRKPKQRRMNDIPGKNKL